MKVQQLMNQPAVTCSAADTLDRAAGLMWEHDCGALPVVGADRRIVGVITDRDVCMAAYTQGLPLASIEVGPVMAKQVHCAQPEDDIEKAEKTMRVNQVRRVPVVADNGRVVGMLSLNDLVLEAYRQHGRQLRELAEDKVVSTEAAVSAHRNTSLAESKQP